MAADEIFILILIVISVGCVAGMAIHSRRQQTITDGPLASSSPEVPDVSQTSTAAASRELKRRDGTRRRRQDG
jgi:hypothetical protein